MATRHLLKLGAAFIVVASWMLAHAPLAAIAAPEFRLVPDRGPCVGDPQLVRILGANFSPGRIVAVMNRPEENGSRSIVVQGDWRIGQNGTLDSTIYVGGCPPTTPDGTLFVFDASIENAAPLGPNADGEVKIATTTFTVDSTGAPVPALPPATPTGLLNTGQGGAAPTLTLTPNQGPCADHLTISLHGAGFPPDIVPSYGIGIRGQGVITWGNLPNVAADGTLATSLELHWCEAVPVSPGAVLVVDVRDGPYRDRSSAILAVATYTVTDSALPSMPNTGGGSSQQRPSSIGLLWLTSAGLLVAAAMARLGQRLKR